ncbi:MAG: Transcriptional regulator, LysR family [Blastococcus sp.]|nr:Transcriptional regulator, LysR family [Blastococcus sp.]
MVRTYNLELRHLRAFVAVAEELNFSRAALKLHMVQQSLSAQVQQLEHQLGVQLFRRTTRRVELSEAGVALLEHARPILHAVTAAVEETRRTAAGESGRLVVSYTPTLVNETLPLLVSAVHERWPGLSLQMVEMWQTESIESVRAGRVDVGMARPAHLDDDLESVKLRDEPIGVVLGQGNPLAVRSVLAMDDLASSTLAIWPRQFSPDFFDQVVDSFRGHGFRGPIQEFEYLTSALFHRDPAARTQILAGRAFSVAFETQFDPVPDGFVWRAVEPATYIPVQLYWRRGAGAAVHRFVDVALQVSAAEGWLSAR